jgi:hypothetical protein
VQHTKTTSWIAAIAIILGSVVIAAGVVGSLPWLWILGVVLVLGGGGFGAATGMMEDVH